MKAKLYNLRARFPLFYFSDWDHLELLAPIHIRPWMYARHRIMYDKAEFLVGN